MSNIENKERLTTDKVISIFKETWKQSLSGQITSGVRQIYLDDVLTEFQKQNPEEFIKLEGSIDNKDTLLSRVVLDTIHEYKYKDNK